MSTRTGDGGPAFPSSEGATANAAPGTIWGGMTLRDYFAGQALAGTAEGTSGVAEWPESQRQDAAKLARAAYLIADAMLAERTRTTGGEDGR